MTRDARKRVWRVLNNHNISAAWTSWPLLDPTEYILLLDPLEFRRIDPEVVALELMAVLPDKKVWVIERNASWTVRPL